MPAPLVAVLTSQGIDSPFPTAAGVLRMATENGARTTPFAGRIGRIEAGRAADIVLIDWKKTTWPYQNPDIPLIDVLVRRARREAVDTVMIGGEVVYRQGRFTRIDRDAVLSEIHARMTQPLTPAEEARRQLATDVMPFVRRFYDGYLDGMPREPHTMLNSRF